LRANQQELVRAVSKYIGDLERNPVFVFVAAEKSSVLFRFDEADALFEKRAELGGFLDR